MRLSLNLSSAALLSVALLCASGQLKATESRHMDPDGGSCPENATSNDASDDTDPDAAAAPARRTQKTKPAAAARSNAGGGGSNRSATPRWHSFLPGMFR